MDDILVIATGVGLVSTLTFALLLVRSRRIRLVITASADRAVQRLETLERRFKPILDAEKEGEQMRARNSAEIAAFEQDATNLKTEIEKLRQQYATGYKHHETLTAEVRALEEDLENVDVGLYRPHFTYSDSDAYKAAIAGVRDDQKAIIKTGEATHCSERWLVSGSESEGERMVRQYQKTMLRAFNAESEAAVANVSWNNYTVMKTRIEKAFEALNKLGTKLHISLTEKYRDARLAELQLVFEAAEKKQQEREEQRRTKAEQREEERVQRELARARDEAAKDETKYEKALAKAREEMEKALDVERDAMLTRIQELESDLAEAHDRKERAMAQAELTKVGHVYIISNLGAFGEGMVKIGLTRRLEPEERIQELGDASVPFPFDLHALIYSENAPELESKLHEHFWDRRVNWANDRKEFFRVPLTDIDGALTALGLQAKLVSVPEAREYRETLALINSQREMTKPGAPSVGSSRLPEDPFAETPGPTC